MSAWVELVSTTGGRKVVIARDPSCTVGYCLASEEWCGDAQIGLNYIAKCFRIEGYFGGALSSPYFETDYPIVSVIVEVSRSLQNRSTCYRIYAEIANICQTARLVSL